MSALMSSTLIPAGTACKRIRDAALQRGMADAKMMAVMIREIAGSM